MKPEKTKTIKVDLNATAGNKIKLLRGTRARPRVHMFACAMEQLGLPVAALDLVQRRQTVDALERVGMVLAEHALAWS
jgi:hypothetical protein